MPFLPSPARPTSNCGLTSNTICAPSRDARDYRDHIGQGNKGDVGNDHHRPVRQVVGLYFANVDAAHFDDVLVIGDARVELAVPNVERYDFGRSPRNSTSVKPPVEAPISRHSKPSGPVRPLPAKVSNAPKSL